MKKLFLSLMLLFLGSSFAQEHYKFLLKFPTRARFEHFFSTLDAYYEKLSGNHSFQFVISCDEDDKVMNSPEAREKLASYPNLIVHYGNSNNKIEACNADVNRYDNYDILMLISDDMVPRVDNFDEIIVKNMEEHFPDYDGVLNYFDGYQKEDLNTLCIMGKKYYDRFGYIYHPDYHSVYVDLEFTKVSKMLGKQVYIDQMLVEHVHPSIGKREVDPLFFRNEAKHHFDHDWIVLQEREARNFDLNPELCVAQLPKTIVKVEK